MRGMTFLNSSRPLHPHTCQAEAEKYGVLLKKKKGMRDRCSAVDGDPMLRKLRLPLELEGS